MTGRGFLVFGSLRGVNSLPISSPIVRMVKEEKTRAAGLGSAVKRGGSDGGPSLKQPSTNCFKCGVQIYSTMVP